MIRILMVLLATLFLSGCWHWGMDEAPTPKNTFCQRVGQRIVLSNRREYNINHNRRIPPTTRARLIQEYDAAGCTGDMGL
jgi:hypothetical protein